MYDFFGPNNRAHHYSIAHGWFLSNYVGLAAALLAFVFLPFFPSWTKTRISVNARQTQPES